MFDARLSAQPTGSFLVAMGGAPFRPMDDDRPCPVEEARARGHALGLAEGRAGADARLDNAIERFTALARAAEALQPMPRPALAALLAEAVDRLLARMLPAARTDADALANAAADMARAIARESDARTIHLHPDDIALLPEGALPLPVRADDSLQPGCWRIATAGGWLEDGPAIRLERFRAALREEAA